MEIRTMVRQVLALLLLCFMPHSASYDGRIPERFAPFDHQFYRLFDETDSIVPSAALHSIQSARHKQRNQRSSTGSWTTEGPSNIGARINTVAVNPTDSDHMLVGFSGGGAYHTTDGGQHWQAVFDENEYLAIGDIEFSPHDPQRLLMSTGDPNISGFPFLGNGVFKSEDGGLTWSPMGLDDAGIISKVSFHPSDPEVLYASSMGIPYLRDDRRGLYRSRDSGATWEQILQLGSQTGVIDFVVHPTRAQEIYAAGWDRIRRYTESVISGVGARIHRSLDGGESWETLTSDLPQGEQGRIGLALAPSNPDRVYALYVSPSSQLHSIHTSVDKGESWTPIPTGPETALNPSALGGFGWYFGKIRVDPANELVPYILGVNLWRYNPTQSIWEVPIESRVHADKHDLVFTDGGSMVLATDGGLYRSGDGGRQWTDIESIATTQFYRVDHNPHLPEFTWGGAQDNGISRGNFAHPEEWQQVSGADGFRTIFHPDDPQIFYVESQRGGLSVTMDGGNSFRGATAGIDGADRKNWDLPVIMSTHDPDVLYYGTTRVYRSTTGTAVQFEPVSEDLTDSLVAYGPTSTITALSESFISPDVLVAGTGDGNLWLSDDGAESWQRIGSGLPGRWYTSIHFDRLSNDFFVTQTGYKDGVFVPFIHHTDDLGDTWVSIGDALPATSVNDFFILRTGENCSYFAATDVGVYYSLDKGITWERLGDNYPFIATYELVYNPDRNILLAATFGKSILSFDIDQLELDQGGPVSVSDLATEVILYPNPARNSVRLRDVNLSPAIIRWGAWDATGRHHPVSSSHGAIDVASLSKGIYLLAGESDGRTYFARFVKQ